MTEGFNLTARVCSPLITKQTTTNTVRLFVPAFITLKACPASCSQLSPLQPESRLMLLPYQRWRCLQLQGENEKETGIEEEGGVYGFLWLAGSRWGHWAYLSLAVGLSAGPVNLPDRSLQVPLILLIQFILLTARMRPLSAGKIKPLLRSWRLSLCCPCDGKPNSALSNVEMKGVMQPPWQSDYSCKHVCGSLFAAHRARLFLNCYLQRTDLLRRYAVFQQRPATRSDLFVPQCWTLCATLL